MDTAKDLFDSLMKFKEPNSAGQSPQTQLTDYCTRVLGSIERLHYDFKEKSNPTVPELSDSDKKNLAKAVSGFANSGGGVLIWGIEDSTMLPKPISNAAMFLNALLNLAHETTDPSVGGIDGDWIRSDSSTGQEGFPVVFIPESSLPPHRVILKQDGIQNQYFVRSGESFPIASHTQLEDMFGRRPQPKLQLVHRIEARKPEFKEHRVRLNFRVVFSLENIGRGTAKFPYLAVQIEEPYTVNQFGIDGNNNFGLPRLPVSVGSRVQRFGGSGDIAIYPSIVHDVFAVTKELDLPGYELTVPPLVVHYSLVAEGVRLIEDTKSLTHEELWAAAKTS